MVTERGECAPSLRRRRRLAAQIPRATPGAAKGFASARRDAIVRSDDPHAMCGSFAAHIFVSSG